VMGTASWRCVRPGFTTPAYVAAFPSMAAAELLELVDSGLVRSSAARRIAVGVASFVDWGHVHVVVRVHVLVRSEAAAKELVRPVGKHLVHVHVERDPAPEWNTSTMN